MDNLAKIYESIENQLADYFDGETFKKDWAALTPAGRTGLAEKLTEFVIAKNQRKTHQTTSEQRRFILENFNDGNISPDMEPTP